MAFSITASLPATTTNCEPDFNPSCFRIASGITICPLEDILVVAISVIYLHPSDHSYW